MHPVLFHVGSLPIYSYGIMLGLSLIVGWFLTLGLAERDGLPREAMANCYVDTALMALAGSRLLYIVTNPADFSGFASFFQFRNGGLVAYGGFVGGLLGSYLSLRFGFGPTGLFRVLANVFSRRAGRKWKPLPLLPWADAAVPSLASGLFITRIGCYLYGCDFGEPLKETAPAWLKKLGTFPKWAAGIGGDSGPGSPAWKHHLDAGLVPPDATSSLPVHPTQIYESLVGLGLLVTLLALRRYQRFRGEIFLWFAVLYGFGRFLLELVRDDPERGSVPPAEPAHVLLPACLGLMALAYTVGVAPRIKNAAFRGATQALAFVPAIWTYVSNRPGEFQITSPIELSTSQLVAFLTAILAAGGFAILYRASLAHPEAAMTLPDFSDWEESGDDADDEDDEDEEASIARKNAERCAKKEDAAAETADEQAGDGEDDGDSTTDEAEREPEGASESEADEEAASAPSDAPSNHEPESNETAGSNEAAEGDADEPPPPAKSQVQRTPGAEKRAGAVKKKKKKRA